MARSTNQASAAWRDCGYQSIQYIGPNRLTHSHLMWRMSEPRCETCLSELTGIHVIFLDCSNFQNALTKSNINTISQYNGGIGSIQEKKEQTSSRLPGSQRISRTMEQQHLTSIIRYICKSVKKKCLKLKVNKLCK